MFRMRIILLISLFFTLHAGDEGPITWEALPESSRSFVDLIIERNSVLEPELNVEATRLAFAALVADCRMVDGEVKIAKNPAQQIELLNKKILTGREVNYLSNQYWRDSSFVAALLRKRGNCLATTTLYVAVARALDLPLYAVFIPEHAFVCWSDKQRRINIETTNGGQLSSDFSYMARFAIDSEDFSYYGWMSPMSDAQLLAQLDACIV
jgi:regulator of sirC expression with transglutaminase-like and TPR domain